MQEEYGSKAGLMKELRKHKSNKARAGKSQKKRLAAENGIRRYEFQLEHYDTHIRVEHNLAQNPACVQKLRALTKKERVVYQRNWNSLLLPKERTAWNESDIPYLASVWETPERLVLHWPVSRNYVEENFNETFLDRVNKQAGEYLPVYNNHINTKTRFRRIMVGENDDGTEAIHLMDSHGARKTVSHDYALQNISKKNLARARANQGEYVFLTEGSVGLSKAPSVTLQGPEIRFQNKNDTCHVDSFCNSLDAIGHHDAADMVYKKYEEMAPQKKPRSALKRLVKESVLETVEGKRAFFNTGNRETLDALSPERTGIISPIVASIRAQLEDGSDAGLNHCVSFHGSWVRCPNFPHALPLTKQSMDLICDHIVEGSTYDGMYQSEELVVVDAPPKKKKKPERCKGGDCE